MYISQQYREIGHVVDRLALEALFEQVSYPLITLVVVCCIGNGKAFQADANALGTFT